MLKCPDSEIAENLETVPALLPSAVPMISPDALMPEVIEAFLVSQIPNKKTARGYRRHITAAQEIGMKIQAALMALPQARTK